MNKTVLGTVVAAIVVGLFVGTAGSQSAASQVRAENAAATLQKPLSPDEQREFARGARYFFQDDFTDAAPIVGRFAMRGQPLAQYVVGYMYYFGKGFPLDRQEGMRWMQLAASQGLSQVQVVLAAAQNGTLQWMDPRDEGAQTYSTEASGPGSLLSSMSDESPGAAAPSQAVQMPRGGVDNPEYQSSNAAVDAFHSRVERELDETSRGVILGDASSQPAPNTGAINIRSGEYMAPAGSGAYVDPRTGTYYAPSGPNGVVDTRTGEYSPVSH